MAMPQILYDGTLVTLVPGTEPYLGDVDAMIKQWKESGDWDDKFDASEREMWNIISEHEGRLPSEYANRIRVWNVDGDYTPDDSVNICASTSTKLRLTRRLVYKVNPGDFCSWVEFDQVNMERQMKSLHPVQTKPQWRGVHTATQEEIEWWLLPNSPIDRNAVKGYSADCCVTNGYTLPTKAVCISPKE